MLAQVQFGHRWRGMLDLAQTECHPVGVGAVELEALLDRQLD
jgi:hypothetical protein